MSLPRQLFRAQAAGDGAVLGGGLAAHMLIGREQEAAGAAGGVVHRLIRLRVHDLDDRVDQRARGEILAGAGADLAGVAL